MTDATNTAAAILAPQTIAQQALAALAAPAQAVPASVITAAVMRDDGGEHPAFCLMVAYRAEKDATAALAMLTDEPAQPAAPANVDSAPLYLNLNDRAMWVLGWNACLDKAHAAQKAAAQAAHVDAEPLWRTDAEIVEQTEILARYLLSWKWGLHPESPDAQLRNSQSTKAQKAWNAACEIQDLLTATDVENAVAEVDDAARAAQGGHA